MDDPDKPGALTGPTRFTLEGRQLSGDAGPLDLSTVTEALFVNRVIRRTRTMRLELNGTCRISYAAPENAWATDPDAHSFLTLCRDILHALPPEARITLGERRGARLVMFGIGVAGILLGAGVFAVALATGASSDRLVAAAVPMLVLVGLGAVIARTYAPARKPRTATPKALAAVLDGILARNAPG